MDESELIRKLKLIEALHKGATTPGEKLAAAAALQRIQERLEKQSQDAADRPIPYTFSVPDEWRKQLLVALLRRHNIQPYRYPRQRHTTVRATVSKQFVDQILWPEYLEMSEELSKYLSETTERIIRAAVHSDSSEPKVVNG
jgi:tRNA nucleotidyltransferase (CCA-adding enzyme)